MEITKQLINQRFIKTSGKIPVEKDWQNINNYDAQAIQNLNLKTYGVLCGYAPTNGAALMVVDCDTQDVQDYILTHPILKHTFQVRTASKKLLHFYIYVNINSPKTVRFDDNTGRRALDLQGTATQVIGPGSTLDDGAVYEAINTYPILKIGYEELVQFISHKFVSLKTKSISSEAHDDHIEIDPLIRYIKQKITIQDVLDSFAFETNGNPGKCPYGHESESNKNFGYNDNTYHCFHCENSGNIFQLYQEMGKCTFIEAKNKLAKMAGAPEKLHKQAMQFIASQKKEQMSELIATEFMQKNKIYTIRNDKLSEIWIYQNGIYVNQGRTYIMQFVRAVLQEFFTTHRCNQIIAKIEADTFIDPEDFFVNENITKIPVQNGVLDLFTRNIEPFSPEYKFFNKLGAVYNPHAIAHNFINFQNEIHSTPKDVMLNQEIYGYCLYRDYKYEKALMKVGNGRNGKGKDIECLKLLLNPQNCVNISLQKLSSDKYYVAELHNKMANLGSDLGSASLTDTEMFKQLTGHDMVSSDRKFLSKIYFQNYAKMIFATNRLPEVPNDDSIGFKDRWLFLEYNNTYKLKDEYDRIPEETRIKDNIKLADTDLIIKLTTPEELSGILNWALDGLDRLFKQGDFTKSSTADNMENYWKRKSSAFNAFIEDKLEITYDPNDFISVNDVKQIYHKYCMEYKLKAEPWLKCKDKIELSGGSYERKNRTSVGEGVVCGWTGVKLK